MKPKHKPPEVCARCGIPPAAWRVEGPTGQPFCSWICRHMALLGELDATPHKETENPHA